MNSTRASSAAQPREAWRSRPALRRSFSVDAPARAKALADALGERPRERDPSREHAALEDATRPFRWLQSLEYRRRAADVRKRCARLEDLYARAVAAGVSDFDAYAAQARELDARARWYEGRASAQLPRFDSVRACCKKRLSVKCRVCATPPCAALPCRCGVVRVCDECADARAEKRRARIAAARTHVLLTGGARGLLEPGRFGGAFSEKMLTVTLPHFDLCEVTGEVREACEAYGLDTTVAARVAALRLAWPKFLRIVRRWLAQVQTRHGRRRGGDSRDAKEIAYYRLFEWTRGHDGQGHPHFHVYLFAPWLCIDTLRRAWAHALTSVGVPCPTSCSACRSTDPDGAMCPFGEGAPHAHLDLRRLEGFNFHALRELVKSGDRKAIEHRLGMLRAPGLDAYDYSAGWTMGDAFAQVDAGADAEAARDLYIALENRRLAQGARGFLLPEMALECPCCGASLFTARVLSECDEDEDAATPREERGPP